MHEINSSLRQRTVCPACEQSHTHTPGSASSHCGSALAAILILVHQPSLGDRKAAYLYLYMRLTGFTGAIRKPQWPCLGWNHVSFSDRDGGHLEVRDGTSAAEQKWHLAQTASVKGCVKQQAG